MTENTEDFLSLQSINEFIAVLLSRTVYADMGRRAYQMLIAPFYNHLIRPNVAERITVSFIDCYLYLNG